MSAITFLLLLAGCRQEATPALYQSGWFKDVSKEAGLHFIYDNDLSEQRRFIETTGGGVAFIDYDNDGLIDIFAVQSGSAPGSPERPRPPHALYHNLGSGKFEDVTVKAGLAVDTGYAQGVSVADYDNDGVLCYPSRRNHFRGWAVAETLSNVEARK